MMYDKPLVSILMTAYNRETLIGEAIESVLNSTYKNFELIICDDASTDNTVNVAKAFAAKDNRIKVLVNNKNLGDYSNRNRAAGFAKGKYIKYLDSDDKLSPTGLQVMVESMERYPEAALGIVQFKSPNNEHDQFPVLVDSHKAYVEHFYGREILRFGPTGSIIVKEIFDKLGGFGTRRFISDTECWLKIAAQYPIVKIQPDVVWWRVHENQEFDVGNKTFAYLRITYPVYMQALYSTQCPLEKNEIDKIVKRLQWKHARDILSLALVKGNLVLAFKIFREADFGLLQLIKGILSYDVVKKSF